MLRAACRRQLSPQGLVGSLRKRFLQSLGQFHVGLMAPGNSLQPNLMKLWILGNTIRLDIFRHRLVDIALTQLRIAQPAR